MINLLSPTEKEEIYKDRRTRALIVFLGALVCVFSAGFFLLLPSVFLAVAKEKSEQDQVEFLKKTTPVLQEKDPLLEATRAILRKIGILEKNDFFEISPLMTEVLSLRGTSVTLDGFFYERTEDKSGKASHKLIIKGESASREALVSFSRALERSALFSDAPLPVGNLVQNMEIPFSLTLTIAPEALLKNK